MIPIYRGKRTDGRGWVYGDLIHNNSGEPHISNATSWIPFKVDPDSVGEFIGITTTDGTYINLFEKDIIEFDNTEIGGERYIGSIIWCDDQALGNLAWGLWTTKGYLQTDFLGKRKLLGNEIDNKLEEFE
jgi:hypothetical protein